MIAAAGSLAVDANGEPEHDERDQNYGRHEDHLALVAQPDELGPLQASPVKWMGATQLGVGADHGEHAAANGRQLVQVRVLRLDLS